MSELNYQEKVELAKALIKSGEYDGGDLMLLWCDHDNLLNESLSLKEHLRLKEEESNQLSQDKEMLISVLRHAVSGWDYEEISHHCGVDQNTASLVIEMLEDE